MRRIILISWLGLFLGYGLLAGLSLEAAEVVTLSVHGTSFRGVVVKITKDEVVIKEGGGRENTIPAVMLTPSQMYACRKNLLDPTDAKGGFELGSWCLEKGLKQEAEDEFLNAARLDPALRDKCLEMIGKGAQRQAKASTSGAVAKYEWLKAAELIHVDMYKKCAPAVVGIFSKGTSVRTAGESGFTGTGTVISPDGLILTGTTVVPKDGKEIKVYFTDGQIRPAVLKSFDEKTESVLIKVEAKALPYLKLANSQEYKVGDPIYSWGNPHMTISKDGVVSLSVGSISGFYNVSSVDDESRYIGPVLETDAAINPGSDGGPLTDAEGNLLGMASLAFSKSRWLGLAIPTSRLLEALPDLKVLARAKRSTLAGPLSQCWAFHQAFEEVSTKAALATVGVRVFYEGEKTDLPSNRKAEELKTLQPYPERQRAAYEAHRPAEACSSGFLVDAAGTVLTAAFNLQDLVSFKIAGNVLQRITRKVTKIFVYLADGTRLEATLAGKDAFYDLAVLKLQAEKGRTFSCVELHDSGELVQGSSVALLGRSEPPGDVTLNSGRVSAIQRYRDTCCQISCMIDYGNLGGPVLDLQGRVIGMAAHLAERTSWRQNCGVGFMLQGEQIKQVLADLLAGKQVEHPKQAYLGAVFDEGAMDIKGVRITRVFPGGPAEKAGLKEGDIILAYEGKPVDDFLALLTELRSAAPGKKVNLKIQRQQQELEIQVELGEKV